ncbi:hypothetical protein BDV96DRAFT_567521 [Lophiotrema nucula]|uniref:DUF6594 domain-containing protein n=1 Tax=Lophiotrema nucula TaxID=690887 RepID=A0A6A5ZMD7_9PLEO|nr:hypothetical protein BDV96DRAFT_567521 [Lophiotrema nucula]
MDDACGNPLQDLVAGYPRLAGQMGLVPETAIFRTFPALNARNLLYQQAELVALEKKLIACENGDNKQKNKDGYAVDWHWLKKSSEMDKDPVQLRLILDIRQKLKEYNEALIQASTVARMEKADKWDVKYIQTFLMTGSMAQSPLVGLDDTTWGSLDSPDDFSHQDLVALRPRRLEDPFSNWLARNAVARLPDSVFRRFIKPSPTYGVMGIEDSSVFRLTAWITSVVASLIPILSIIVLWTVRSMVARLGIIAAFNLLFSTCLSTFTNAKRAEVFAVTAA